MHLPPEYVTHLLDPMNRKTPLVDLMRAVPSDWRAKREYQELLKAAQKATEPKP